MYSCMNINYMYLKGQHLTPNCTTFITYWWVFSWPAWRPVEWQPTWPSTLALTCSGKATETVNLGPPWQIYRMQTTTLIYAHHTSRVHETRPPTPPTNLLWERDRIQHGYTEYRICRISTWLALFHKAWSSNVRTAEAVDHVQARV